VLLAAIAGCASTTIDGKHPLAGGDGLQLDLRDHPSLGTVAVFANYGIRYVQIISTSMPCGMASTIVAAACKLEE
jgi:hypothetical protein